MRNLRNTTRGFTLIEMMVSVAILAIVTLYLTELLVRQSRTYTMVDNVLEAQQNLRALANLMERDLRATGMMVPQGGAACGFDTLPGTPDGGPDVLFITDADPIDPAGISSFQLGAALTPGAGPFPTNYSGTMTFTLGSLVLDGNPFYDLDGDGLADSDFLSVPGGRQGGVILVDRLDPTLGTACGLITGINVGAGTMTVDFTVSNTVPAAGFTFNAAPTELVAIPANGYFIDAVTDPNSPRLMRNNLVLAPDVEDLQFALFFDLNGNGLVDNRPPGNVNPPFHSATEYPGSAAAGSVYVPNLFDNEDLQEIRVTLSARTRSPDPEVMANPALAQSQLQAIENRFVPGNPDGFRRRMVTISVQPRNVAKRTSVL